MQIKSIIIILLFLIINQANAQIEKIGLKTFFPGTTKPTKDIIVLSFFNKLLSREAFQFKKGIT